MSGENKTSRVSSDQHLSVFPVTLPLAEELLSVLTEKGQLALRQSLHTLRIYVFPLPGVFNSDLPQQATERRRDLCFSFTNDGLGPELEHTPGESIHRTHQFASEVIFHRLLLRSPFLTSNLSEAHLVYVPFYAGLACLVRSPLADGKTFWDMLLQPNSSIHTGIPHFMALAKVEQVTRDHCGSANWTNWGWDKKMNLKQSSAKLWIFISIVLQTTVSNSFSCLQIVVLIQIPLKFVLKIPINNKSALVQVLAWHLTCDKPLSVPVMAFYWRIYGFFTLLKAWATFKMTYDN